MRDKKWKRTIDDTVRAAVRTDIPVAGLPDRPAEWVKMQGDAFQLTWLLAHADDAVIWGKRGTDEWITSSDLRGKTLQQVRLFSREAELLAWRNDEGQWQARVIQDGAAAFVWKAAFDEYQMIIGTKVEKQANGLTEWVDGAQGLRHDMPEPPMQVTDPLAPPELIDVPPRLIVRHYLADEPLARIVASRLAGFEEVKK